MKIYVQTYKATTNIFDLVFILNLVKPLVKLIYEWYKEILSKMTS